MRIITNSPYDAPAEPLLKSLGLPSVNNMIYQESASMVYKAVNNQAPIYLTTLFNRVSSVTSRSLRNSELNIRPPRLKLNMDKTVLHTEGPWFGIRYLAIVRKQIVSNHTR